MANQRLQVQGVGLVALRPAAAPVDTFVQTTEGSKLGQLAAGLSGFAPSLARFSGQMAEQKARTDQSKGEEQARLWQEEGKTYKQAIKEGLIRPDQSPWFRMGAQETFGRAAAETYRGDLVRAMGEAGINESTEMGDFDTFEADFRQKWKAERLGDKTSTTLNNAFGRLTDNYTAQLRGNFAQAAGGRLEKQATEAVGARVFSIGLDAHAGDVSPAAVAQVIQLDMERALAQGMNPAQVNQAVVDAITDAARKTKNPDLLDILDNLTTNKELGGVLGLTQYARDAATEARREVDSEVYAEWNRTTQQDTQRLEAAGDGILTQATQALRANADADLTPFADQLTSMGLHAEARSLSQFRSQVTEITQPTSQADLAQWTDEVYRGKMGLQGLLQLRPNINAETFDYLLRHVENHTSMLEHRADRAARGTGSKNVWDDPIYRDGGWEGQFSLLRRALGDNESWTPGTVAADKIQNGLTYANNAWFQYMRVEGGIDQPLHVRAEKAYEISKRTREMFGQDFGDSSEVPSVEGRTTPKPTWQTRAVTTPRALGALGRYIRDPNGRDLTASEYEAFQKHGIDANDPAQLRTFYTTQTQFLGSMPTR